MYELKKIGKVFTSKFLGTGPPSYKKRIYRATVSQRLRNTAIETFHAPSNWEMLKMILVNHSWTPYISEETRIVQGL